MEIRFRNDPMIDSAIDLIGVLKTVMHYGIVSEIEQRKFSWEI